MTDPQGQDQGEASPAQNVYISATNGGVAAYRIDKVIVESLADLKAATTVLSLDEMVNDAPPFVGRETELQQIAELLSVSDGGRDNILVVTGPPGVGKTALVQAAASAARATDAFGQVLFVDLRGYAEDPDDRVQPESVLSKLLLLLGIDDADIPADPAEQAIRYQQRLNALAAEAKPVLLWLDNASDRSQFDSLRPASDIHKAVVTTRETFGHIPKPQVIEVGLMRSDEAVQLLISSASSRNPTDERLATEPAATRQLARLCDHLPLALQIIAALLADEPDRPVAELIAELASEEDRLKSLEYSTDLSVRAAFGLSYKRLPDNLQRLFRLLSVVPGGDIGLETAGWLIEVSHTAVRPQLMALVRSHLVQQHVRNRWSMHDLLRLHSAELSALEPEDAERALKFIVPRYLLGVGGAAEWLTAVVSERAKKMFTSPEHAAAWFEAERPTVEAIVISLAKRPDYRELVLVFAVLLCEVLKSQRHWLKEFHDIATIGASLVPYADDRRTAACVLNHYGAALRAMRQFGDALEAFQRAAQVAGEINDVGVAAAARSNMGNVYLDQGRPVDEVLAIYWEDVRASRESDPPHRHSEAAALTNIGGALAKDGRFAEAIESLRVALAISRELEDKPGIASAEKNLGGALCGLAREQNSQSLLAEAVEALQEASAIYQERGNISGWADAATNLGQAQCQLRRFADGIPNLEAAVDYFEKSGQTELAAQVREDLRFYRQHAQQQGPWAAEDLGENRYRFTNTSGRTLAMVTLRPHSATHVAVEDNAESHTVSAPVDAGSSFIAVVRGRGTYITATAVPSMTNVYWDFAPI